MTKKILAAGIALAALIPSMAMAQQTCEERKANRTAGTVAGAAIGALAGGVVAGRDDRTKGAVIGGIAGALIGNQLAKGSPDCTHAYGFYDNNNQWHANNVAPTEAAGYYDRNGEWVQGRPNGYYDNQNRWISAQADDAASGYYAANGRWVPASAQGYYDVDGRWVAAVPGHYENGRWVQGSAVGRYDDNGRWMAGQAAGHRDANGVWIADPLPGYYDNGRWVRGQTQGYYDARGNWHSTGGYTAERRGDDRADYQSADWRGAPSDLASRRNWLMQRIQVGLRTGALRQGEGNQALREIDRIRREERNLSRSRGALSRRQTDRLMEELNQVNMNLHWDRDRDGRRDDRDGRYRRD